MKTGRTVVISGAAGGMGSVFARRFLENGDLAYLRKTPRSKDTGWCNPRREPSARPIIEACRP